MRKRSESLASDREAYTYFSERIDHFKDLEKLYRDGFLYVYINSSGYLSYKPKRGKEI